MKLLLPFPPSVNSLYPGNAKKRWKSKKYKDWEVRASWMLDQQKYEMMEIPVQITHRLGRPDKRIRDISNYIKATEDFLVSRGVLKDDSLIHWFGAGWDDIEGLELEILPYIKKEGFVR